VHAAPLRMCAAGCKRSSLLVEQQICVRSVGDADSSFLQLLRDKVRECYIREGVNHFQYCRKVWTATQSIYNLTSCNPTLFWAC
jgi:hypothetical protein